MSIPEDVLRAAEDRRRYPRRNLRLPVDIAVGRAQPTGYPGYTIDFSAGGALLEVDRRHDTGSFLTLWFQDPDGELTCNAIVQSSVDGRGVGVEFVGLSDRDQERIYALVALGHA